MEKVPMTAEGLVTLEEELKRLKEERPLISKAIGIAREHGDLKENAEYHAAKDRQGLVEARLKDIEGIISHALVIDPSTLSGDTVKFGATVKVTLPPSGSPNCSRATAPTCCWRRCQRYWPPPSGRCGNSYRSGPTACT